MMAEERVRFGIVGCAQIARKLSRAIGLAPNAVVVAVGSRSIDKAQRFIADNGLPESTRAHGSYEAVLDDPAVDAVYVPLPASLHVRWAVAAAGRGKHVLLEKPAALCGADLNRILEACESTGVQFMDGSMWLHHPRTATMREILSDAGRFGPLKLIHSSSTFPATPRFLETNIRADPNLDSLGALGDLGWYCIGSILWATDYRLPATAAAIPGATRLSPSGVILSCDASFHWADGSGTVATFHCSFLPCVSMELSLHGTNGTILVPDLAVPYREGSASFELNSGADFSELHLGWTRRPEEVVVPAELPQEALMVREFSRLVGAIRSSGCRPDARWAEVTRKTQVMMDAVKRSIELGCKPVEL